MDCADKSSLTLSIGRNRFYLCVAQGLDTCHTVVIVREIFLRRQRRLSVAELPLAQLLMVVLYAA